jgi:hypothetical protein
MLGFIRQIYRKERGLPEGLIRQALALGCGRAEPLPGGWARLRRRAEAARWAAAGIEPLAQGPYWAYSNSRALTTRLAIEASGMVWRLSWRSSLAACPLF